MGPAMSSPGLRDGLWRLALLAGLYLLIVLLRSLGLVTGW